MAKKVVFSGQQLALIDIVQYHRDIESSLRVYYSQDSSQYERQFAGYTEEELWEERDARLLEHDRLMAFSVLSALEAALRVDYLQRVYGKKKDGLSKAFREIYKEKGERASLVDDILQQWKILESKSVGDIVDAYKYRHWLAHGRYWTPKLGQKYDYQTVYYLAAKVCNDFPL